MAKVYHSEIFGLREEKYDWLNKHHIKNVKWKKIEPNSEFYLFIPQDQRMQKSYQAFTKITEIFPVNSVGIVTSRDSFVIDFDRKQLEKRIRDFLDPKVDEDILKQAYNLKENQSWKIKEQREKLQKDEDWQSSFNRILYRPFDEQWIFYHEEMVERSRTEVMQHMLSPNLAIVVCRQQNMKGFQHVFISDKITEACLVSNKTKEINYIFPLYKYSGSSPKKRHSVVQYMLFEPEINYQVSVPNIASDIFDLLSKNFNKKTTPEEIFYYIYAILYCNTYRTKYAEFLKTDFPRIPFTKEYKLFIKFGKLGKQLADLHLLKSKELDKAISKFPISGSNRVEKLNYSDSKIWINDKQFFTGIKEEVWAYQIGGYQVCDKWLKDRKGRKLSLDEVQTYCNIITALSKTILLQAEIDAIYEGIEN